ERVSSQEARVKNRLAVNSMGGKVHPCAENDIVAFNTVGSLLRSLGKHHEDTTPRSLRSPTQRLFASDAYAFLKDAANSLGFKTISDLDEFGNETHWRQMWENAITSALISEDLSQVAGYSL